MGDGIPTLQKRKVRRIPIRGMVHGIWYRTDIYIPILASTRLRRLTNTIWSGISYQSHIGDFCIFFQFSFDTSNGSCKSFVPWFIG